MQRLVNNKIKINSIKFHKFKYFHLFCLFLFTTCQATAKENNLNDKLSSNDESSYIDEADLFQDVQTVVSATRLKQKITDTPVSVTVIDQAMIEASGATEVHELLRYVPGYFAYSIWGNQFAVSNHIQPRDVGIRLEVQVNGRSVYEPLFTAVDWPSLGIDVADIDYIEVIRGSSATTYGSNAFLGAINIVTKDPVSRPKASIRTRIGNIGRKELTVNHSGNIKDIDYAFSMVYKSNTGFPALASPKNLRDLSNDSRASLNISVQGSYIPNLKNEIKFDVGVGETKIQIPEGTDLRGYSNRKHDTHYELLKWIYKGGKVENSIQLYHSRLTLDDDFKVGFLSDLLNVTPEEIPTLFPDKLDELISTGLMDSSSERYDIEFEQKGRFLNADYVWGVGARRNKVKSPTLFGNGLKSKDRYRAFGSIDWRVNEKANINLGILTEKTKYRDLAFSPRIAINLHPIKNHTIRTSITTGKRIPSVTFENLNTTIRFQDGSIIDTETVAAADIGIESITAYELAYITKLPQLDTQLDIKIFKEDMKNLIGLQVNPFNDLDGQVRTWGNNLNFTTKGLEIQATHKFSKIPGLNARLAYSYIEASGSVLGDTRDPFSIKQASAIPKHSATLLLTKKFSDLYDASTTLQYQSDYQDRGAKIKRVDFRIGRKIKLNNAKGKLNLVVQNAFNQYNDFSRRNKFNTRAFLQLQLDF